MIPLLDLKAQYRGIESEIEAALREVLESQEFILGARVKRLEEGIAKYCGVPYAVGVASGSDALLLCLMAWGIGPGDEVITSPFTFFATAGSVSRLGARPVFVDIDPKTFNIDPRRIEEKITRRTKAVIPVHLFGQCADMEPFLEIGRRRGLKILEDAAQAIGAAYAGGKAGSMGDAGALSFFPSKNLGAFGDGGMILTRDENLARTIETLRVHGASRKHHYALVGCNSRLDALQAAVLSVKLKHLDGWSEGRRRNAQVYDRLLSGGDIVTPHVESRRRHVYNQYVIRTAERDDLAKYLAGQGIGTEIYYPLPLHMQPCYAGLGYREGDFPEAEKAAKECLSLPVFPELTRGQLEQVVSAIRSFFERSPQRERVYV